VNDRDMKQHSILVLLVMSACASVTPQESYTFRSKWPVSSDALWQTAIAATQTHYRIAHVDRQHALFVTEPEQFVASPTPIDVAYSVQMTYHEVRSRRGNFVDGITVDVTPVAFQSGRELSPDAIPVAALEHRADLLGDIRERAWRSGVVH
jgi:hypothetical protein